ncbi:MAG TPA: DUF6062 family protein [Ktedonobacteraceae bacterium]
MNNKQQQARRTRDGEALSQACEQEGCPVCLVTLTRLEKAMDFWQYEWASEVENRQTLLRSRGFCSRHTWQLVSLPGVPSPFALTMVYRSLFPDLLEDVQRDLARVKTGKAHAHGHFWSRIRARWLRGSRLRRSAQADEAALFQQCPFCHRQEEIEQELIQELLLALSNAEFREGLSCATGFCLAHFTRAMSEARDDQQRVVLLEARQASLQRNMAELDELVRKHDYRFLQEARGPEMTSWRRAAELLVGNRGIR